MDKSQKMALIGMGAGLLTATSISLLFGKKSKKVTPAPAQPLNQDQLIEAVQGTGRHLPPAGAKDKEPIRVAITGAAG